VGARNLRVMVKPLRSAAPPSKGTIARDVSDVNATSWFVDVPLAVVGAKGGDTGEVGGGKEGPGTCEGPSDERAVDGDGTQLGADAAGARLTAPGDGMEDGRGGDRRAGEQEAVAGGQGDEREIRVTIKGGEGDRWVLRASVARAAGCIVCVRPASAGGLGRHAGGVAVGSTAWSAAHQLGDVFRVPVARGRREVTCVHVEVAEAGGGDWGGGEVPSRAGAAADDGKMELGLGGAEREGVEEERVGIGRGAHGESESGGKTSGGKTIGAKTSPCRDDESLSEGWCWESLARDSGELEKRGCWESLARHYRTACVFRPGEGRVGGGEGGGSEGVGCGAPNGGGGEGSHVERR